jgi:hypothetical protein
MPDTGFDPHTLIIDYPAKQLAAYCMLAGSLMMPPQGRAFVMQVLEIEISHWMSHKLIPIKNDPNLLLLVFDRILDKLREYAKPCGGPIYYEAKFVCGDINNTPAMLDAGNGYQVQMHIKLTRFPSIDSMTFKFMSSAEREASHKHLRGFTILEPGSSWL